MKTKSILITAICALITAAIFYLFTPMYLELLVFPLLVAVVCISGVVSANIKAMAVIARKVDKSNFTQDKKMKIYDNLKSAANEVIGDMRFLLIMLFIAGIAFVCSHFDILYAYTQPIMLLSFLLSVYPCYDIIIVSTALDMVNDKLDLGMPEKHNVK